MELFKTPFGSRLYGTATETSDYDWKVVYLPPIEDLLIGTKNVLKNKFYSTSSKEFKNTADDTDTEYIALQTLCKDFMAGQAYAIEVVFALRNHWLVDGFEFLCSHFMVPQLLVMFEQLTDSFLTSQMNGMVGYAYHQAKLYGTKGERLNLLKELAEYTDRRIADGWGIMTIDQTVQDEVKAASLKGEPSYFDKLHGRYPQWFDFGPPAYVNDSKVKYWKFQVFKKTYQGTVPIREFNKLMHQEIANYGKRANAAAENEGHDWKALSHAVRVTLQAWNILENQHITFPFDRTTATLLRNIKLGNIPFDVVNTMLQENIEAIDLQKTTTTLPPYSEHLQEQFNTWLKNWVMDLYDM